MIDFVRMRWLINQVPKQLFEIEKAMSSAVGGTQKISSMPRGSSAGDKIERDVIRLEELRGAYAETIDELVHMRALLRPMIDALENPNERAVMRLRYMDGYSPDKIAEDLNLNMPRTSVYRYLQNAEREIILKSGT